MSALHPRSTHRLGSDFREAQLEHPPTLDDDLESRALEGDVWALCAWGAAAGPVEYDELGWGD
jgi:hypothetical protein